MSIRTVWELPCRSQEFMNAPELSYRSGEATLTYDWETEEGYAQASLRFLDVSALSYTAYVSCSPEQVEAYDRLVIVGASNWLPELQARRVEEDPSLKHFRIFFDDIGCFDIVARSFAVPPGEGAV